MFNYGEQNIDSIVSMVHCKVWGVIFEYLPKSIIKIIFVNLKGKKKQKTNIRGLYTNWNENC